MARSLDALTVAFTQLWHRLGATTPAEPLAQSLLQAYAEPHRAYHTLRHLEHCLAEWETVRSLAQEPDLVELALWFHDAVYEPLAKNNEARSAALALAAMADAGLALVPQQTVQALILATRHDQPPTSPDAKLLVDIDLAILGQSPPRFDEYEQQIRQEYILVPDAQFRQGRAAILEQFLQRRPLYHTDPFRQKYEAAARANLQRSLAQLRG